MRQELPDPRHYDEARLLAWLPERPPPSGGLVVVLAADISDLPLNTPNWVNVGCEIDLPAATEAHLTARYLGRAGRPGRVGIRLGGLASPRLALMKAQFGRDRADQLGRGRGDLRVLGAAQHGVDAADAVGASAQTERRLDVHGDLGAAAAELLASILEAVRATTAALLAQV